MVGRRHLKDAAQKPRDVDYSPALATVEESRGPGANDEGLVGLLTGLKMDPDNDSFLRCPSCGEDIEIERGQCPKCRELIRAKDPYAVEARVLPVIDAKGVVYVHLDVQSGDLSFIQNKKGTKVQHITV